MNAVPTLRAIAPARMRLDSAGLFLHKDGTAGASGRSGTANQDGSGSTDSVRRGGECRAMKPTSGIAALMLLFLAAAPVEAVGGPKVESGYYAGLNLIGGVAAINGVSANGFAGALEKRHDRDLTAAFGGHVGYRWASLPMRTELEVAYRYRFDFDNRDAGPPTVGYENNLATLAVLFNMLFEYRNRTAFTPYAGGSLGWAQNRSSVDRDNLASGASSSKDHSADNLAWGVTAGISWRFAARWDAELGYRYISFGEVDTGTFATGERITADDYTAHEVLIGLSYRF